MQQFDVAVVGLGALGSAAAYHAARLGVSVIGLEQFELGHVRGASHDTSRIIRTSYGAPEYVRFAQAAYRDWAAFEAVAGERFTSTTGGIIMLPRSGPYHADDFTGAMDEVGVPYELLEPADVRARWPQIAVPDGVDTVFTADSGIAHAARSVAALQMQARAHGAVLRDRTPVARITPEDGGGVLVHLGSGSDAETIRARKVIVAADAWANRLLDPLGEPIPLRVMQEQVTYFSPADPTAFDPTRFPVWIWEDDHCFYGFPTFGEPTIKAARDQSENLMAPEERTFVHSDELLAELVDFMGGIFPASGRPLRTVTCQYAITPDRRFVISPLRQHPDVVVGLGAGHAFKFTPAIGRVLAELAVHGQTADDLSAFGLDAGVGIWRGATAESPA